MARGTWVLAGLAVASVALGVRAQPTRPATEAEAYIAEWTADRPEYRRHARRAIWAHLPGARWSLRPEAECLAELRGEGVRATPLRWTPTPAPAAVAIEGPIGGVDFHKRRDGAPLLVACELAARLPAFARVLRRLSIDRVEVLSALRRDPVDSFHHIGLAIDVTRVWVRGEPHSVEESYPMDRSRPTCGGAEPDEPRARLLRRLACALGEAHVFSSVITPNFDDGHRDHFHLDVRPDDPWFFVR